MIIYLSLVIWKKWEGGGGGIVAKSYLTLVIPSSVARQAPLSLDSPGKNTGVGCHGLLQDFLPLHRLESDPGREQRGYE